MKKPLIKRWLPLLLIIAAGLLAYWNSFEGVFVYDDIDSIRDNIHIRKLWPLSEAMSLPLWSSATTVDGRPFLSLTFAINRAVFGPEPWGYHLVNLIIHVAAGLLLFGVVRRTLELSRFRERHADSARWLALAVALIWVVHPLQTESVTYIVQRAESLMGMLFLLTLYCAIRGFTVRDTGCGIRDGESLQKETKETKGGFRFQVSGFRFPAAAWLVAAALACAIGMGVKQTMFSAPILVFLYDAMFVSESFGDALKKRKGFYAALCSTWLIVFGIIAATWQESTIDFVKISPIRYLMTQPMVLLHYLRLSVWPSPLVLDYGWPLEGQWSRIVFPGLLILGMLYLMFRGIHRRKWHGFALAWFFFILAPTSSIAPTRQAIFEHRMYLSLAVVVLIAVLAADWLIRKISPEPRRRALISGGMMLVAVIGLGCITHDRNRDYHSALGIWQQDIAVRPRNALAHLNLGNALQELGRYGEAVPCYRRALQLDPSYAEAHYNWGVALAGAGRIAEAVSHYQEALRIEPDYAQAHNNLSHAFLASGKPEKSAEHAAAALRINPDLSDAHFNLGNAQQALGRSVEAVNSYKQALEIKPDCAEALMGWGNVFLASGRPDDAIEKYREATSIKPGYAEAYYHWGMALEAKGRQRDAIAQYKESVRIKPSLAEAYLNIGNIHLASGRTREAISCYKDALRARPGYSHARENLGAAAKRLALDVK